MILVMTMLELLFGSKSSGQVLAFLVLHADGYPSEIARASGLGLFAVQKQLAKYQEAGLVVSRTVGRKRVYSFSPGYPLLHPLKRLIRTALSLQTPVQSARLPESLRAYFWDYPFDQLSWERDQELVIRRLLAVGSWDAIIWLRRRTGDAALRQWLITHRARGLNARQLRFWSLIYALPRRLVRAWLPSAGAGTRSPR